MGPMHESTWGEEENLFSKPEYTGLFGGGFGGNVIGKVEAYFDTNYKEVDLGR